MSRRIEKEEMYSEIVMSSKEGKTLEEIGYEYGVTKARAWQIVRFSELGDGDYYTGYKMFMDKKAEIYTKKDTTSKERSQELRGWLNSKNVRLIKGKYDDQPSW
tara:strand:+ start:3860 stop:4171 length:312 start_codon:yes stop_codon:yes gene_type:complete